MKTAKYQPVLRIVALYALLAGLWIFFSDWLLARLISDQQPLTTLQTYKGWFFVAVTTLLLYGLLRREWQQRARSDAMLRASEASFRLLFTNNPHPMWVYDLETLAFLEVNETATTCYGYSREEFLQMRLTDIRPPEDHSRLLSDLTRPRPALQFSGMWRHVKKNGEIIDVEITSHTLDFAGRQAALVVAQDVTGRRQAEERLRLQGAALEAAANAIVITDRSGTITWVNPAYTQLTGYSFAESVGQNPRLLKSGLHGSDQYQRLWQTILNGQIWHGELINRRKDGSLYIDEQSITPVRDAGGEIIHFVAIKQDITERVRRERELEAIVTVSTALREAQTRSAMLPTILNQLVNLVQADAAALALRDPATGELVFEVGYGDFAPAKGMRLAPATGISHQVLADGRPYLAGDMRAESRFAWPHLIDQMRAAACIPLITQGMPIGVMWAGRREEIGPAELRLLVTIGDIAANAIYRMTLYEQVQIQAQQVQQIINNVPEGLLLLDQEWRVALMNPAAAAYLALLAGAGVGDRLAHLGDSALSTLLAPPSGNALAHEIIVQAPQRHVFEVVAQPMATGAAAEGWVLILRDVTKERQMQEQVQQQDRLAAVGQLAAGIAHDFNNIMAVIVLYSQLLQSTADLSSRNRERLATIYQQAQHATNLIQQILDFSRRSVMERSAIDLLPFLKDMVKLWQRTLPENIIVNLTYDESEYVINADPTRLQQALMNLVVNARDAMPEGGSLHLQLSHLALAPGQTPPVPAMMPGDWLCLQLTDSGIGIPPQVLSHIFEPFFTTKGPGLGAGLGLAQVYGIVRQHDGHITLESQVHVGNGPSGTTFRIYLPLLAVPDAALPTPELPLITVTGNGTVLLVEDDFSARAAIRDILEAFGYRVIVARDGRSGLDVFTSRQAEIDLVLCDMVMPEMGGVELYRALKQQLPALKMIIMTGYPLADEGRELLEQGIVAWVQKPFMAHELIAKIEAALDKAAQAS